MNEERVLFWLDRVASEKVNEIKNNTERLQILLHQLKSFKKMDKLFKIQVVGDLETDLEKYKWTTAIKQIKT